MSTVYLALGSNLGDRLSYLRQAVVLLKEAGLKVLRHSSVIETEPVGGVAQGKFLNAVLKVQTDALPEDLHVLTRDIERKLGRVKKVLNGPRVIDIDILLYDDLKLVSRSLMVPHPRMKERAFVMGPLKEIAEPLYRELMDAHC